MKNANTIPPAFPEFRHQRNADPLGKAATELLHPPAPCLLDAARAALVIINNVRPEGQIAADLNAAVRAATEPAAERDRLREDVRELREVLQNALNVLAGIATGQVKTISKDSPAISRARAALAKTNPKA